MTAINPSTNERLRVGVVGCGKVGTIHAQAVKDSPFAELVALCDIDPQKCAKLAALHPGVPSYANFEDLLKTANPDVVTIATPDYLHADPAIAAANSGCHVFVEKPMAMTLKEAKAMSAAAQINSRQMAVDYNRRFGFAYLKAIELLKAGDIGDIRQITLNVTDGVPACAQDRGPFAILYLLLTHHIDLLRMVAGEIVGVGAQMRTGSSNQIDTVSATFTHQSGALSQLSGAWLAGQNRTQEQMVITGNKGVIFVDDVLRSTRLRRLDPDVVETHFNSVFTSQGTFYDTVQTHLQHFLSAVKEGRPTEVAAIDGIRGLEIVERIISVADLK